MTFAAYLGIGELVNIMLASDNLQDMVIFDCVYVAPGRAGRTTKHLYEITCGDKLGDVAVWNRLNA